MKKLKLLSLVFFIAFVNASFSYSQSNIIRIWPSEAPAAIANDSYAERSIERNGVVTSIERVTDPTITMSLPSRETSTGAAVLICPGGGYSGLAIDHEGYAVAKWLNDNGIAAFILKYRLPSDLIMKNKTIAPLQDAQEAIRIIRRNATLWNINPGKIGVLGFSAGGHLASTLSTHFNDKVYEVADVTSARPDFSILIYPVITMDASYTHGGSRNNLLGDYPSDEVVKFYSNELQVGVNTPPAFMVHSMDDNVVPVKNSLNYYDGLMRNNIPSELHVFQKGGHGYGLAVNRDTQMAWPDLCIRWLKVSGF